MSNPDAKTELKRGRPHGSRDPAAKPCMQVLSGSEAGTLVYLEAGTHVIGRATSAKIRIDDDGVSREHAKVVITDDGIVNLLDLQSTNGTFLNGAPIDVTVVREGDRIHVGPDVTMQFIYRDPAAPEVPAAAPPKRKAEPSPLSPRELEVAQLVAEGLTNADVGRRLHISPRTVTTHLVKIYEKLDLHSRTALTRYVLDRGLQRD
ncbi:MAG: LuxR C-terminal-related transcriptional regulator [Myxococcota bacterium]